MATIVYGTLRYDTNAEEGYIKFTDDPREEHNKVTTFDIVSDWIYHLEVLREDLRKELYPEDKND